MSTAVQQFDVHERKGSELSGYTIGRLLATTTAPNHRAARLDAEEAYDFPVVVVPHQKPNEKLERALAHLDRLAARQKTRTRRYAAHARATAPRRPAPPLLTE